MRASICKRISEPGIEPVTISGLKAHLRVETHDDDEIISSCIKAATASIEEITRRAYVRQRWVAMINEAWRAFDPLYIPRPPFIEADSLEYRNDNDEWTEWESYRLQENSEPLIVSLKAVPSDVATPEHDQDAVWSFTYWAGYGATPTSVPDPIRAAIKLLAGTLYEARTPLIIGTIVNEIPFSVKNLIEPFTVPWGASL